MYDKQWCGRIFVFVWYRIWELRVGTAKKHSSKRKLDRAREDRVYVE